MKRKHETKTIFIGIDPGVSGGIVVIKLRKDTSEIHCEPGIILTSPMPSSMRGILSFLIDAISIQEKKEKRVAIAIEKVTGYMKQGKGIKADTGGNMPGARMFTFGRSYGSLLMACVSVYDIFPREITPRQWQRGLDIPTRGSAVYKGESKDDFKRRLQRVASKMYPTIKVTAKTCDALLIATYLMERTILYNERIR